MHILEYALDWYLNVDVLDLGYSIITSHVSWIKILTKKKFGQIFVKKNIRIMSVFWFWEKENVNSADTPGILLPNLLWEKIVLVIKKNYWNSRQKAMNLQNFWKTLLGFRNMQDKYWSEYLVSKELTFSLRHY